MQYSREATAKRAPGQPLILTALGRFESAPGIENMEVAKDRILQVVLESDRHIDNDIIYLNGLKFLGGCFSP